MAQRKQEPTEKTSKGYEVRVPKRGEFFRNLKKIGTPKGSTPRSRPKK